MLRTSPLLLLLLLLLPLAACGQNRNAARAEALLPEYYVLDPDDKPAAGQHLRYAVPGSSAGGLDIAVTDYVHPETGTHVALFGVVHVADEPYYADVEKRLGTYDVVLYEGVKPAELSAADWQAGFNRGKGEVASLQSKLARWFGFQFQLEALDYTAPNFVHADMTEQEFLDGGGGVLVSRKAPAPEKGAATEKSKTAPDAESAGSPDYGMGDRSLTSAVSSTLQAVEKLGESVLSGPSVFRSMGRQMFAETMGTADIGSALDMFPGLSELILDKRNEVVIDRLKETLVSKPSSIAIFYGAAHMADLEVRLADMGFERAGAIWLRAWALRPPLR